MSRRWLVRTPGSRPLSRFRRGGFRTSEGVLVPPGFPAVRKTQREERALNAATRTRRARLIRDDVVDTLTTFRENVPEVLRARAAVSGDVRVIVNALRPNELEAELASVISEELEKALEDGVEIGLRFAPQSVAGVSTTVASEAAVSAVLREGALAALQVTQTTQAGISEILALGLRDSLSPTDVALRIGDLAGLTPAQVRATETFRATRTRQLLDPLEAGFPRRTVAQEARFQAARRRTLAVVDRDVAAFRDRQIFDRGTLIAETETQKAITVGERAFWDEVGRTGGGPGGDVAPETISKTWRTVLDARVCPICEPLHGATIRLEADFSSSVGALQGPPAHPRCRCFLQYGKEGPNGIAPARPDRGPEAIDEQRALRRLEAPAVRDDLQIARQRQLRIDDRLSKIRPGTKAAQRAQRNLDANAATIRSLEDRLSALDGFE